MDSDVCLMCVEFAMFAMFSALEALMIEAEPKQKMARVYSANSLCFLDILVVDINSYKFMNDPSTTKYSPAVHLLTMQAFDFCATASFVG